MKTICAIHQPNFFPWLGYFDKISRADTFIFLDKVLFSKGSLTNRVKVAVCEKEHWLTCPIIRKSFVPINDIEINETTNWRKSALQTIRCNYAKTPHYKQVFPFIESLFNYDSHNLADFNMNAIKKICEYCQIQCQFKKESELGAEGKSTELLVNLIRSVGANHYMAGGGAAGYQDDDFFEKNDVGLLFQEFKIKPYRVPEEFIPGLSIIDYLMWQGKNWLTH